MIKDDQERDENQEQPMLINTTRAASLLGISTRKLWTMTHSGEVPHTKLGRRVLYPPEALKRFIEDSTQGGAA